MIIKTIKKILNNSNISTKSKRKTEKETLQYEGETSPGPCVPWSVKRELPASQATANKHFPFRGITVCATVPYKLSPIMGSFLWRCQDHSVFCLSLSLSYSLYWHKSQCQLFVSKFLWRGSLSNQTCSSISKLKATARFVTSFYFSPYFVCFFFNFK